MPCCHVLEVEFGEGAMLSGVRGDFGEGAMLSGGVRSGVW